MVSTVQTTLGEYFGNVWRAATSTFEGLAVTMSWMFRRPMTVQYPDKIERPLQETLPEGWRGVLEADLSLCLGCGLCEKSCPIGCIVTEAVKDATTGKRVITRFDINVVKCMHCGLCSEACNTGALRHTTEFEIANREMDQMVHHFVTADPVPVYKKKKDQPPPESRPLGEALREAREKKEPDQEEKQ
jgi:formate hydrogenlyase subunit 6/NADH:ubiquinone oxidoreductase subunit I